MAKVKCILGYYDTKLERHVDVNEEFEVAEDRAKQLAKAKVAVLVSAPEKAVKPAATPKKTRAKREA